MRITYVSFPTVSPRGFLLNVIRMYGVLLIFRLYNQQLAMRIGTSKKDTYKLLLFKTRARSVSCELRAFGACLDASSSSSKHPISLY